MDKGIDCEHIQEKIFIDHQSKHRDINMTNRIGMKVGSKVKIKN